MWVVTDTLEWVYRDLGALCRQLLGDTTAMGLLVGWIIVKGEEGAAPLSLAPFQHIAT